jgi:Cu/Ag efflux pump CusA
MLGFVGPLGVSEIFAMLAAFVLCALLFLAVPIYLLVKLSHLEQRVAQLEKRQGPSQLNLCLRPSCLFLFAFFLLRW